MLEKWGIERRDILLFHLKIFDHDMSSSDFGSVFDGCAGKEF